ncbi:MAG: hypothetical protein ACJ76H_17455 [Bacteriovoracaceae bacterium]
MSELSVAHTYSWMVIFAFRAHFLSRQHDLKNDNYIWTQSIIALFTYPVTFFTYVLLILSQCFNSIDKPSERKEDWRIFFAVLAVCNVGLFFYYLKLFPDGPGFFDDLLALKGHRTALLMLAAFAACFVLRPVVKIQNYLIITFLGLAYCLNNLYVPWHSFVGRTYATIVLILLQGYYLFILSRHSDEQIERSITHRAGPFIVFLIIAISHQSLRIESRNVSLENWLSGRVGVIPYDEANGFLKNNLKYNNLDWNIQPYSVFLQLRHNNNVRSMIESAPGKPDALFTFWGPKHMRDKFIDKNISFPEELFPDHHLKEYRPDPAKELK